MSSNLSLDGLFHTLGKGGRGRGGGIVISFEYKFGVNTYFLCPEKSFPAGREKLLQKRPFVGLFYDMIYFDEF